MNMQNPFMELMAHIGIVVTIILCVSALFFIIRSLWRAGLQRYSKYYDGNVIKCYEENSKLQSELIKIKAEHQNELIKVKAELAEANEKLIKYPYREPRNVQIQNN